MRMGRAVTRRRGLRRAVTAASRGLSARPPPRRISRRSCRSPARPATGPRLPAAIHRRGRPRRAGTATTHRRRVAAVRRGPLQPRPGSTATVVSVSAAGICCWRWTIRNQRSPRLKRRQRRVPQRCPGQRCRVRCTQPLAPTTRI